MGRVRRGHAEGDIEWRNRGCFGCVCLLFSPRAEVLLSIAKRNNSIFYLTGNNANLSHTSRFLCLPHGVTSFLHRVLAGFLYVWEPLRSTLSICIRHSIVVVHDCVVFTFLQLHRVWTTASHICCVRGALLACAYVHATHIISTCVRETEGWGPRRHAHSHVSLTHSVRSSLYPSPAVIGLILSPC